jgi:hypothetical protein
VLGGDYPASSSEVINALLPARPCLWPRGRFVHADHDADYVWIVPIGVRVDSRFEAMPVTYLDQHPHVVESEVVRLEHERPRTVRSDPPRYMIERWVRELIQQAFKLKWKSSSSRRLGQAVSACPFSLAHKRPPDQVD